jgi:hypothetical protein
MSVDVIVGESFYFTVPAVNKWTLRSVLLGSVSLFSEVKLLVLTNLPSVLDCFLNLGKGPLPIFERGSVKYEAFLWQYYLSNV